MVIVGSEREGEPIDYAITVRPPSIYLDHCALCVASEPGELRDRLLLYFEKHGTLMFSWLNMAEACGNYGDSLEALRSFVEAIGIHWYPVCPNYVEVIRRERHDGANAEIADRRWMLGAYLTNAVPAEELRTPGLGAMFRMLEENPEIRQRIDEKKRRFGEEARRMLASVADRWDDQNRAPTAFRRAKTKTERSYYDMIHVVRKIPGVSANDAIDYFHAIVAFTHSDLAVTDAAAAERAKQARIRPPDNALVLPLRDMRPDGCGSIPFMRELYEFPSERWKNGGKSARQSTRRPAK